MKLYAGSAYHLHHWAGGQRCDHCRRKYADIWRGGYLPEKYYCGTCLAALIAAQPLKESKRP